MLYIMCHKLVFLSAPYWATPTTFKVRYVANFIGIVTYRYIVNCIQIINFRIDVIEHIKSKRIHIICMIKLLMLLLYSVSHIYFYHQL